MTKQTTRLYLGALIAGFLTVVISFGMTFDDGGVKHNQVNHQSVALK